MFLLIPGLRSPLSHKLLLRVETHTSETDREREREKKRKKERQRDPLTSKKTFDRWVTNLSEDRKRFYLVSSLLDPHTT